MCHGASCLQANDPEGRKNDRLRKEKKGKKGRNLTKVDRYLQGKRGVPTTGKFRLVAGNTIRAEARNKMALMNPLRHITLISPLKWNTWDEELRTKAKSNDLWAYINPSINGKKLLEKPTKPKVLDFPKHIYHNH